MDMDQHEHGHMMGWYGTPVSIINARCEVCLTDLTAQTGQFTYDFLTHTLHAYCKNGLECTRHAGSVQVS
jgi:hypothetical protein